MSEPARNDEPLLSADDGRVRLLTLNRPASLNAFSERLYDGLAEALLAAAADARIAVVVLTGAGKAYSAGVDVCELAGRRDGSTVRGKFSFEGLIDTISTFPKPLICAVNGLAVGVGATMLPHADLVFMSSTGRICCPFTKLGLSPEAGSSYTLQQALGSQRTAWMLYGSEWLSAAECVAAGLAWKLCEPERLMTEALECAQKWAGMPIASLLATKRTLLAARADAIVAARRLEVREFEALAGGPANIEGLAALSERRSPDFARIDEGR
jgi:enoyl-CoA hydratase/carnithine racemase